MKKLAFCIPTNRYNVLKNLFLSSLINIKRFSSDIILCFNFQMYTDDQIKDILNIANNNGFECRYTINKYNRINNLLPFNIIRNDSVNLVGKDAELLCFCDDDNEYLEGYDNILELIFNEFDTNKNLGMICGPIYSGKKDKYEDSKIINVSENHLGTIWTSMGLFIRNLRVSKNAEYSAFPPDSLEFLGPNEEKVIAFHYSYDLGYKVKRLLTNKYNHTNIRKGKEANFTFNKKEFIDIASNRNTVLYYLLDKYYNTHEFNLSHLIRNIGDLKLLEPWDNIVIK